MANQAAKKAKKREAQSSFTYGIPIILIYLFHLVWKCFVSSKALSKLHYSMFVVFAVCYYVAYMGLVHTDIPSSSLVKNKGNSNEKKNEMISKYIDLLGLTLFTQFLSTFYDQAYMLLLILPFVGIYYAYQFVKSYLGKGNSGITGDGRQTEGSNIMEKQENSKYKVKGNGKGAPKKKL